jgi:hypothetical protein
MRGAMTRRIVLVAVVTLALPAWTTGIASAADLSSFKPQIGQGTTKFHGETKFKARGSLSFLSLVGGLACTDSLSLERQVQELLPHHQLHMKWILIRDGDQEQSCKPRTAGLLPFPANEGSSQAFLNDPAPYRQLLKKGKLRLRYTVKVKVNGLVAYRKTITAPVTKQTLSRSFRVG